MASCRANAFDVQMAGGGRVTRRGFVARSFYLFFTQLPAFIVPRTDAMDTGVPGTIMTASQKEVEGSRAAPSERVRLADEWGVRIGVQTVPPESAARQMHQAGSAIWPLS